MTLTEEQREAIRVISKLPMAIGCQLCHPYIMKNYGSHFIVLRAMIDSSEQIGEPNKLIAGFDLPGALAEIERMRAELDNYGDDFVCQMKCKDARIKELEAQCEDLMQNCNSLRERAWKAEVRIKEQDDALVEERTGAIRCESYDHCEGMYRIDLPDAMIRAQQELQAEGKIGPDAKPRVWQITDERKAAIRAALLRMVESPFHTEPDEAVLRAMLQEAGQ